MVFSPVSYNWNYDRLAWFVQKHLAFETNNLWEDKQSFQVLKHMLSSRSWFFPQCMIRWNYLRKGWTGQHDLLIKSEDLEWAKLHNNLRKDAWPNICLNGIYIILGLKKLLYFLISHTCMILLTHNFTFLIDNEKMN